MTYEIDELLKKIKRIHFIGILLLFALMIYVTWNDIVRFVVPIFS